jgi:hypothetical protein
LNGIIGDRAGLLGENEEYWMGRKGSGLIWNSELQGGSPRLCWLRIDRLALVSKLELCTGAYRILWGPANWVASCAAETKTILPYLTDVKWDSEWTTHGVSTEAYAWKTCTRVRWALIVSLTALWTIATRGALPGRVCRVVRLLPLQGLNWLESPRYPRIWVTLAHCSHSVKISTSYFCDNNYVKDYLVVMVYVNKCCLETFACLE